MATATAAEVREWANETGEYGVLGARGRLPVNVVTAYDEAHPRKKFEGYTSRADKTTTRRRPKKATTKTAGRKRAVPSQRTATATVTETAGKPDTSAATVVTETTGEFITVRVMEVRSEMVLSTSDANSTITALNLALDLPDGEERSTLIASLSARLSELTAA